MTRSRRKRKIPERLSGETPQQKAERTNRERALEREYSRTTEPFTGRKRAIRHDTEPDQ